LTFPLILGRDLAGTVVETGPGVKSFKSGDRVWATGQGAEGRPGTFAEFASVDERWLNPIPPNVSEEDIVAVSLTGVTAQLGLARNSDLFLAGVDFHGVHDWSLFLPRWDGAAASPAAPPDLREAYQLAFASSPDAAVDSWRSPVLLIHGDDDRNVPFAQTRDLTQRLRGRGVTVEELIFPDEIHDLLLWRDWVRSYRAAADFFDRRLRGGH